MAPSSTNTEEKTTPHAIAEKFIVDYASSLHQQLARLITQIGTDHLLLLSKRDQKEKAIQHLVNDETHIPRSVRFNFTLSTSKQTESNPEYLALRDKAKEITDKCTKDLKQIIIQAAKIHLSIITTEIQQHLAKYLRIITQSLMITNNQFNNFDNKAYDFIKYYLPILTTNAPIDEAQFCELYKQVNKLDTFPPNHTTNPTPTPTTNTQTDHSDSMFLTQITQDRQAVFPPPPPHNLLPLKNIIEAVFVTPWQRFLEQQQKNKISSELHKLTNSHLIEQATETAVLDIDSEPPADKKELKALIRQETKAETQEISKKIDLLFQQLSGTSKNPPKRGHGGASTNQTNMPHQPPYNNPNRSHNTDRKNPPAPRTGHHTSSNRHNPDHHPTNPDHHPTNHTTTRPLKFTPPPPKPTARPPSRLNFTPPPPKPPTQEHNFQPRPYQPPTTQQRGPPRAFYPPIPFRNRRYIPPATNILPPTISQPVTLGTPNRQKRKHDQVDDNDNDSKPASTPSDEPTGQRHSNKNNRRYNTKRPRY
jgi:hypothetical protein